MLCQWECTQPYPTEHPESLGCKCVDGYISLETGEQLLQGDDDTCQSALESSFISTTRTSIIYKSTAVTNMKDYILFQRAPANDIEINLFERFSKSSTYKANGDIEYSYAFSGLEPGHRYNIGFSHLHANGENRNIRIPAVTSCSACVNSPDKTGPPNNFKLIQDNGHVMFTFDDCLVCEEAYSFTRMSYKDGNKIAVSFTRDYFFIPKQAYGAVINPHTEASDNLVRSKLIVGDDYSYCVRAVHPILYMDHPYDHDDTGQTLLSSKDTCVDHKISWEASIHGKITTEPNAGILPIKDVEITYSLLNENGETPIDCNGCSGSTVSREGGSFDIAFNVNHESLYNKNVHEVPVRLTFRKTTIGNDGDIEHKFVCNQGEDDCGGDIGTIIYLSHLQFRELLHVYDDTSVPFSGKISIEGTAYPGAPEGCAITGVEICLVHERNVGGVMKTNETLVCGETDFEGIYSVPVIIGSRVDYIDILYHNHIFDPALGSSFKPGTVIEAGASYHSINFMDISKAKLVVDVVGGLCNLNLGESTVQVNIVGCDWVGINTTQPGIRGSYNNVPSHLLDVEVIEITDSSATKKRHDHIWSYFQGERPLV